VPEKGKQPEGLKRYQAFMYYLNLCKERGVDPLKLDFEHEIYEKGLTLEELKKKIEKMVPTVESPKWEWVAVANEIQEYYNRAKALEEELERAYKTVGVPYDVYDKLKKELEDTKKKLEKEREKRKKLEKEVERRKVVEKVPKEVPKKVEVPEVSIPLSELMRDYPEVWRKIESKVLDNRDFLPRLEGLFYSTVRCPEDGSRLIEVRKVYYLGNVYDIPSKTLYYCPTEEVYYTYRYGKLEKTTLPDVMRKVYRALPRVTTWEARITPFEVYGIVEHPSRKLPNEWREYLEELGLTPMEYDALDRFTRIALEKEFHRWLARKKGL